MGENSIQTCLDLPKGTQNKTHLFPYISTSFCKAKIYWCQVDRISSKFDMKQPNREPIPFHHSTMMIRNYMYMYPLVIKHGTGKETIDR